MGRPARWVTPKRFRRCLCVWRKIDATLSWLFDGPSYRDILDQLPSKGDRTG